MTHEMPPSNPVSCSNWDIEVADGDTGMDEHLKLPKIVGNPSNLCQQFSSELKKKFEVKGTFQRTGLTIMTH